MSSQAIYPLDEDELSRLAEAIFESERDPGIGGTWGGEEDYIDVPDDPSQVTGSMASSQSWSDLDGNNIHSDNMVRIDSCRETVWRWTG